MRRFSIPITMLATAGLAVAAYAVHARVLADRPDCPGRIICPVTGALVCKDRCPVRAANVSDCPGQIRCPLTGKLVCQDRCPACTGSGGDEKAAAPRCGGCA